ncbi:hypothetical protein ACT2CV_00310 [Pasteurellaceae bacterium 22721_9_1]
MKKSLVFCTALFLAACGGSHKFSESDLNSKVYKGYWAMQPVDDAYRVIQFQRNGSVKIYDYSCEDSEHYRLNSTETVHLSKIGNNAFTLLDNQKKPFAQFKITQLNGSSLQATQTFLDKKIEPHSVNLTYINMVGAKPLCNF